MKLDFSVQRTLMLRYRGFRANFPGVSGGFRGFPGVSGLIRKNHTCEKIHFGDRATGFPPAELDLLKLKKGKRSWRRATRGTVSRILQGVFSRILRGGVGWGGGHTRAHAGVRARAGARGRARARRFRIKQQHFNNNE